MSSFDCHFIIQLQSEIIRKEKLILIKTDFIILHLKSCFLYFTKDKHICDAVHKKKRGGRGVGIFVEATCVLFHNYDIGQC